MRVLANGRSMQRLDSTTLQIVASLKSYGVEQQRARSSHLVMAPTINSVVESLDNVAICCSIENLWQSATSCTVAISHHGIYIVRKVDNATILAPIEITWALGKTCNTVAFVHFISNINQLAHMKS
jgi:hypothetical protein